MVSFSFQKFYLDCWVDNGWEYSVSGNKKTTQEAIAFVQTRGDGGWDENAECWVRQGGGLKTYLYEVDTIVPDGSAVRWRGEGRGKDDTQVSGMGNWIDKWHLWRWENSIRSPGYIYL